MIENLNDKEARELLVQQKFGHLGCVLESGEPYVLPVNYLFAGRECWRGRINIALNIGAAGSDG